MLKGYVKVLTPTLFSYSIAHFKINEFSSPYQLDRNAYGGGILEKMWEDLPSKLIKEKDFAGNIKATFVEIHLRKKKWLPSPSLNPQRSDIRKHLRVVGKNLASYSSKYENFILLGDSDVKPF